VRSSWSNASHFTASTKGSLRPCPVPGTPIRVLPGLCRTAIGRAVPPGALGFLRLLVRGRNLPYRERGLVGFSRRGVACITLSLVRRVLGGAEAREIIPIVYSLLGTSLDLLMTCSETQKKGLHVLAS